jgi:hypothetical protein
MISGIRGIAPVDASSDIGSAVRPVSVSALDLWAFILPAVAFIEITAVGRLILTEILMLVMIPWLWSARDRPRLPRWIVVVWGGWLVGQVLTDLVVGSAFQDLARGWAAIVLTITDFAAILVLAATPRRARFFALGLASGGLLGYVFVPSVYTAGDPWKWAFAFPIGLTLAASLSGRVGARLPLLPVGAFAAFGALNLYFGYRSLGGVSLLAAGYLLLGAVTGQRRPNPARSLTRAAVGLMMLAVTVAGTLQLYDAAASSGLLGYEAQAKYASQSGTLGILIGGRPEALVSTQAIIDSPILGHGSWAKDFAYVDLLQDRQSDLGYQVGYELSDVGLIPTHSYLTGSWVWAGFPGGIFWLAVALLALRLLAELYSVRMELAPLLVFGSMLLLWGIAFSPYGFSARLSAAFGIVLCLLGRRLMKWGEAVNSSPQALGGRT